MTLADISQSDLVVVLIILGILAVLIWIVKALR